MRVRKFGKKKFTCKHAGFYLSFDKTIGIYHVMQGTSAQCWEAYFAPNSSDNPMDEGHLLNSALTLAGTIVFLIEDQKV